MPLLILHPEDDGIIKVDQAGMLAEAAKGNDLVRVWTLPPDRTAYSRPQIRAGPMVYRTFFERWATYAERTVGRGALDGAELVYSAQDSGSANSVDASEVRAARREEAHRLRRTEQWKATS